MVYASADNMVIVYVIYAALFLLFAGVFAGSFYFYNFVVDRKSKSFLQFFTPREKDPAPEVPASANDYLASVAWLEAQDCETWNIISDDGLKLEGYFLKAPTPTHKTVIIAHGYRSKAKDFALFAKFFSDKLGFNVLMPDARGHGNSAGDYIGFGWPERHDYLKWIQKVIDVIGSDSTIALFGASMGGATVMMTSGENLPEHVKAIIEDCGYSSVHAELSYQLKAFFKLPSFPFVNTTSMLTDIKAGYSFFEASSIKQVEKNKVPMLFIHGSADTFVPTKMVYEVYDACSADKDILIVEGAGHGMSYTTAQTAYERKITDFLNSYMT